MRSRLLFFMAAITAGLITQAQNTFPINGSVGIGTSRPDASALFQVRSTTKGVIIPRHTRAQRLAIVNPATGLLVYQRDDVKGFYVYDSSWKAVTPDLTSLADRALNNLTQPTAINMDLLPDVGNTRSLGYEELRWANLYLSNDLWAGNNLIVGNNLEVGRNLQVEGDIYGQDGTIFSMRGYYNTFLGTGAGRYSECGEEGAANNTVVGADALLENRTGTGNTAVGSGALEQNEGNSNSAFGAYALAFYKSGYMNTAVGYMAITGEGVSSGSYNTAVGSEVLQYNSGNGNSALGSSALFHNTKGSFNTAVGRNAMGGDSLGGGSYNTAVGADALKGNTSGRFNTAIGEGSLTANTTSSENQFRKYGCRAPCFSWQYYRSA
jgi:trimeric autotransporter adhesin